MDFSVELLNEILALIQTNLYLIILGKNFRGLKFSEVVKKPRYALSLYADTRILNFNNEFLIRFI